MEQGVLVTDLMRGDGPHREASWSFFILGECAHCHQPNTPNHNCLPMVSIERSR